MTQPQRPTAMAYSRKPEYRVYPTLLDAYSRYLRAADIHDHLVAWAGNGKNIPEFSWDVAAGELIDRINRKAFKSEAADRGTAFNTIIDDIAGAATVLRRRYRTTDSGRLGVDVNGRLYSFKRDQCYEVAARYDGGLAQLGVSRCIATRHGEVELYGYIDVLMMDRVVDIKTTGARYVPGKFRHNWQHIVYPYCLNNAYLRRFDYDVYVMNSKGDITERYNETYNYLPERDDDLLRDHIDGFLDFVEEHRNEITDLKIFNQ